MMTISCLDKLKRLPWAEALNSIKKWNLKAAWADILPGDLGCGSNITSATKENTLRQIISIVKAKSQEMDWYAVMDWQL